MLVCAAVVNVPLRLPAVTLPVTANEPNVPTDVMLVCAAVVNVPLRLPAVTLPEKIAVVPVCAVPLILPVVTLPETAKLVKVPTCVIAVCEPAVTVAAVIALVAWPLKAAVIVLAWKLPLASRLTTVPATAFGVASMPTVTAPVVGDTCI